MVMGEQTIETQVAVIGGGPGGYAAAFRAADLGLEVTLINQEERLGGVCLLRGCIPAKVFLEITHLLHDARQAKDWGVTFGEPDIDLDGLREWKEKVVGRLTKGLETLCQQRDVQLIQARAEFEDAHRLRLQEADVAHVEFEQAILATGSTPISLPGVELAPGGRVLGTTEALDVPSIPETLLVVGGGFNGVELGSMYAALGSRVTLVEMTEGLLPGVDRDLVKPLARRIRKTYEATYYNTKVASLEEDGEGVEVTLEGEGASDEPQRFDRVLVVIGRRPNSHKIGLENTAVERDEQDFVVVDEEMRTSEEHIFAVGDLVGPPMLAHKALHQGKVAAGVIAGEPEAFDARCVPAVIYSDPQIAWCGLTEPEANEEGREVEMGRFSWGASGRALTMGEPRGLTKLVFDPEVERVLGVGVVGRGAEDLIAEGALAIEMGAVAQDLALTIHPHPTLSETISEAAQAFMGLATHVLSRKR